MLALRCVTTASAMDKQKKCKHDDDDDDIMQFS